METEHESSDGLASASALQMLLPDVLDVRACGPLAAAFLNARGHQMRIDASNVTSVGAQCLQVIASARLTWERDGVPIVLVNLSEPFKDALSVSGMDVQAILEPKVDAI